MKFKINRKAQIIIETTVALMVLLMMLVGMTKIFLYYSGRMVKQQQNYQNIRKVTGESGLGAYNNIQEIDQAVRSGVENPDFIPDLSDL